jgi:hypothetical protein
VTGPYSSRWSSVVSIVDVAMGLRQEAWKACRKPMSASSSLPVASRGRLVPHDDGGFGGSFGFACLSGGLVLVAHPWPLCGEVDGSSSHTGATVRQQRRRPASSLDGEPASRPDPWPEDVQRGGDPLSDDTIGEKLPREHMGCDTVTPKEIRPSGEVSSADYPVGGGDEPPTD